MCQNQMKLNEFQFDSVHLPRDGSTVSRRVRSWTCVCLTDLCIRLLWDLSKLVYGMSGGVWMDEDCNYIRKGG